MKYHAPTNQFTVEPESLQGASLCLLNAMALIRQMAGKPLSPSDKLSVGYDDAGMAETYIVEAAKALGIDLGGERPADIDLSKFKSDD